MLKLDVKKYNLSLPTYQKSREGFLFSHIIINTQGIGQVRRFPMLKDDIPTTGAILSWWIFQVLILLWPPPWPAGRCGGGSGCYLSGTDSQSGASNFGDYRQGGSMRQFVGRGEKEKNRN